MHKFMLITGISLLFAVTAAGQPEPRTVTPFLAAAPVDDVSETLIDTARSLGLSGPVELFDVEAAEPVRVLKATAPGETLLLFHLASSGQTVFARITNDGENTQMTVWDGGPDEAIFDSGGIRIQPRADAFQNAAFPVTTNGVIDNLRCLGRAVGIDFSNLTGSGLTNLISRATCTGANSLALWLTAASCLSIPAPAATAGCITGMTQLIACGIVNCATCSVTSIGVPATLSETLATSCRSTHRTFAYGKFYKFTLSQSRTVTIDLGSGSLDMYLFLLQGNGTNGSVLSVDDDSGPGTNSRIVRTLPSGTYTIEVTTFGSDRTGPFTLSIR